MSKYYDNADFEKMVLAVSDNHENPACSFIWVGPYDEKSIETYEKMVEDRRKELKQLEIGLSLCRMANQLNVKYKD